MNELPDHVNDSTPMLSEMWLIRHGESTGNRDRLLQGQEDLPLTELGHEQARKLAGRLGRISFDALYSSDLARALQTAVHLGEALHLGTELDARLREIDVGSWAGLSTEQISERFPEEWRMWQERDPELARGGGESYLRAQLRVVEALEELARRHPGKRIAVVCHGGVMRAYLAHLLGLDLRLIWHLTISNTGICRIRPFAPVSGGSRPRCGRIDAINDVGHLEMALQRHARRTSGVTTRLFRKDRS
jgi:broad specificity phosphatase PhoE